MRKFVPVLILLIAQGYGNLTAQNPRQYLRTGEEFYRSMNYEDAIEQFTRAIELDPNLGRAYINRALSYSKTGNHEMAATDFDRALVLDKKNEELYYLSGREWHLLGDNKISLARLNEAISRKHNFLEAYEQRAEVYFELQLYDKALEDYQKCLKINDDAQAYFNIARVLEKLGRYDAAEDAYFRSIDKNDRIAGTYYSLALLQYNRKKYSDAIISTGKMLALEPGNLEGILLQSQILTAQGNYPKAIEVLSMASAASPMDPRVYIYRGDIYLTMNQATNAIIDYTRAIDLDPENAEIYLKRGAAYEEIKQYDRALADYEKLLALSSYNHDALKLYEEAGHRLFELNREENKPRIVLDDPVPKDGNRIDISREAQELYITGLVDDESEIQSLYVNGYLIPVEGNGRDKEFHASVALLNNDKITIQATDIYNNSETAIFPIRRTEIDPPDVQMIAPYSADGNTLYIDSGEPQIYLEGRIVDESKIAHIYVDSVQASYIPADLNPYFSALVNIENKSKVSILVEDEFGNKSETAYWIKRDARTLENNPMGKTWVVFVENSDYIDFPSLEGPVRDVSMMKAALSKYQIQNVVDKKNMTKEELQRFFSIELRDMIRSNRINSLVIWYAGHGTYINGTGYWLPVDATRGDEFSYYNIGQLKASMESYPDFLIHKLVITDACESGPSFYSATRSDLQERDCNDWESTKLKSSQVFSSAGYEDAVDDSQFTRTFANVLNNNPGECLSIEKIVMKVIPAVVNSNQQEPQFGIIPGLEDENGTFFFIPKDY